MQTRGRARTEWRLSVYRTSLEACRAGGYTLARFVSIPADRLRLSAGEADGAGTIPIWIDPSLGLLIENALGDFASTLATGGPVDPPVAMDDPAGVPALDLSLIDGRLEPRRLAGWLSRRGLRLEKALAEALAKGFALVGRAPNGEELALLGLFSLEQALQQAVAQLVSSPHSPLPALAALLLERATAQAAEHPAVDAQAMTARCGLRAALLQSHYAFQRSIDAVLSCQLNTYRTQAVAVQAARALLRSEADLRAADDAIDRIAGSVLSVPEAVEECWLEGAMELLREALAEPFLNVPLPAPLTAALASALGDPAMLSELITDHEQREKLLFALGRISPPGPFRPALELLKHIGAARSRRKQGEAAAPLPHGGTLASLATDQARGAYLMAADSAVRRLLAPLEASLERQDGLVAEREWKRGQRYRFGAGPEPIANPPSDAKQAQLFVALKDFTQRAHKLKQQAMVPFLRSELYDPVFAEAARLRAQAGGDDEALAVSSAPGEALAFRGEIVPVVELAQAISGHLARLRLRLDQAVDAVLSGPQLERLRGAEAEGQRLFAARKEIEVQLEAQMPDHERDALESRLRESQAALGEALETLRRGREELLGGGLEAGTFISYGAPAIVVPLEHRELGAWPLTLGERVTEASLGTARPATVRELRAQWSERSNKLPLAFAVSVGAGASLRLPAAAAAEVQQALAKSDGNSALRALAGVFKQLQAELVQGGTLSLLDSATALYNEGCALSSDALTALRAASKLSFLDRTLGPGELAPALQQQLAFPPGEPLVLALGIDPQTKALALCLRFAGALQLAGMDGPTEVWELCDPRGPFAQLLARHHLPGWLHA